MAGTIIPGLDEAFRADALGVRAARAEEARREEAASVLAQQLLTGTLVQVDEVLSASKDTSPEATARTYIAGLLSIAGKKVFGDDTTRSFVPIGSSGDACVEPVVIKRAAQVDAGADGGAVEYKDVTAYIDEITHTIDLDVILSRSWEPRQLTPDHINKASVIVKATVMPDEEERTISRTRTWVAPADRTPWKGVSSFGYIDPAKPLGTLLAMYDALRDPELNPQFHTSTFLNRYNPSLGQVANEYAVNPQGTDLRAVDVRDYMPEWLIQHAEATR